MHPNPKISVIIPALNEAASIANVLNDIPPTITQIIVADNGSTDDTVAIAQKHGATVVHEPQRGYGAACLRGIQALDNPDIVVFLDGDYADHPDQMHTLIDPILNNEADMVIGSRTLGNAAKGALTPQARFGNQLACFLIHLFWGIRYTDLGPFRAIRYTSLQQLHMADTNYGWTVEMQIKAALHKLRTTEVPVDYRKRIGRSKVSGTLRGVIGAGYKILATIFISAARYHLSNRQNPQSVIASEARQPDHTHRHGSTEKRLIVFTRYPEPGKTKTRLIPELGPQGAADLQRQMTEHALRTAAQLPDTQIEIRYTGADKETMTQWLGDQYTYTEQHPGDLGERMHDALTSAFAQNIQHALIIGIDCPAITPTILQTAFQSLHKNNITIGPATDGGYYLIGATKSTRPENLAALFTDIQWGTETVYPETIQKLETRNIPWHRLVYLNDVDLPEDLPEWEKFRSKPTPDQPLHQDHQNNTTHPPDTHTKPLPPPLTVIIPTLNESQNIQQTIQSAQTQNNVEIIIVDGGSTDDTCEKAINTGVKVITAPKGRAAQMNHAAAHASADTLLFLHADTLLPPTYLHDIQYTLANPSTICGAFCFKTDTPTLPMKIISRFTNLRARLLQLPYGDQALFMPRTAFHRASGYPDIPIMEDYILIRKLRKQGPIRLCSTPIITSARRWHQKGPWRTTLLNQLTILTYHLHQNPTKIARRYHKKTNK